MSYKPLKEMTVEELTIEARVWGRAVVDSQIRQWVAAADRYRNKVYGEIRRRQRPKADPSPALQELSEIADGAYGDDPATRGRARDLLAAEHERLARAAGWEQGGDGDVWWHSWHGSWKNAVSWGRTYATAREVIESDDYPEYQGREDER